MTRHMKMRSISGIVSRLLLLVLAFILLGGWQGAEASKKADAEAAKKAAEEAAAKSAQDAAMKALEKNIQPVGMVIEQLLMRSQSRYLFSPEDTGKLADAKFKLRDFMKDNPQSAVLIRPVYQTGILCFIREQFDDAYEMFSFLAANFPNDPYGLRAKAEIRQLKKKLGADYFNDMQPDSATAQQPAVKGP